MEYVGIVVVGLAVGLLVGRFLAGNNFTVRGDVAFALAGAVAFALGLRSLGLVPVSGAGGAAALAGIGAIAALLLRRVLRTV